MDWQRWSVISIAIATPALAQEKIPKRPRVAAGVDSHDAGAYLAIGRKELDGDPEYAARAYWWASRIAPGSAEAMDGRAVATTLADSSRCTSTVRRMTASAASTAPSIR